MLSPGWMPPSSRSKAGRPVVQAEAVGPGRAALPPLRGKDVANSSAAIVDHETTPVTKSGVFEHACSTGLPGLPAVSPPAGTIRLARRPVPRRAWAGLSGVGRRGMARCGGVPPVPPDSRRRVAASGFCTGTREAVAVAIRDAVFLRRIDDQPLFAGFLRDGIPPDREDRFDVDVRVPAFMTGLTGRLGTQRNPEHVDPRAVAVVLAAHDLALLRSNRGGSGRT